LRQRLLDLQEQMLAVRRHEKSDSAKRANAADADDLEGNVGKRVASDKRLPLWKQGRLIISESGMRMNLVALGCGGIEMINQGWPVFDMGNTRFRRREMRKIIIRRQISFCFHQSGKESFAQLSIGDSFDLALNVHAGVPDFEWRLGGEIKDEFAIGFHGGFRELARLFVRHLRVEGGNRDTGREPLQIHREIDAGQSLVEIVDVEENTSFRRVEGPEIHQMAVAAGLHVRAGLRKSRE